jgi:hypothetical protein
MMFHSCGGIYIGHSLFSMKRLRSIHDVQWGKLLTWNNGMGVSKMVTAFQQKKG